MTGCLFYIHLVWGITSCLIKLHVSNINSLLCLYPLRNLFIKLSFKNNLRLIFRLFPQLYSWMMLLLYICSNYFVLFFWGQFGRAMKGLLTNPIIIMVFLGICSNFLFSQKLPAIIAGFLNVLASSFSATALFFLGIGMVGKIKKSSAMFFLTPILLIGCKL